MAFTTPTEVILLLSAAADGEAPGCTGGVVADLEQPANIDKKQTTMIRMDLDEVMIDIEAKVWEKPIKIIPPPLS
jgi:hypothetical protein